MGLTLTPRANVTAHAVPSVHSEAHLFECITYGYPGHRMPALGQRLSGNDRQDWMNFVRTLALRKP